jgi:hypothetical protein
MENSTVFGMAITSLRGVNNKLSGKRPDRCPAESTHSIAELILGPILRSERRLLRRVEQAANGLKKRRPV